MRLHSHETRARTTAAPSRPTPWAPHTVMWAAIALSAALLGLLLALGWGDDAWTTAGGLLFVACIAVCTWAGVEGRITDREVHRAIARLAATRRARGLDDKPDETDTD